MDKFVKRLQSRLTAKGHRFTKDECRTALSSVSATPAEPTEEEMSLAFNRLANTVEVETQAIAPAQTTEISQAQEPAAEIEEPKSEESSLTVPENSSQMTQAPVGGISTNTTQAISQAVAQVGASGNDEAIELLTALANELSEEINSVEEMTSALITAYLGKRQNVLASAIGTINNLRSAQTSSFQAGLTSDFFDRKNQNKRQFLSQIQNIFN